MGSKGYFPLEVLGEKADRLLSASVPLSGVQVADGILPTAASYGNRYLASGHEQSICTSTSRCRFHTFPAT